MSLINYASKEVTLKIVYYGPGLSGKTTNLQHLHSNIPTDRRGKLLSLATESDRTLFFDFMPMTLGKIGEFTVKFQLYTVPGQVRYNATRKLVLKGADAVVFVADSQKALMEQNIDSYRNMLDNLTANNLHPDEIPIVLQYNKRDLDDVMSEEELNSALNSAGHRTVNAAAVNGTGVEETFRLVTNLLLRHFAVKHKIGFHTTAPSAAPPHHPQPASAAPVQPPPQQQAAEPVFERPSIHEPTPEPVPEPVQEPAPTPEPAPETVPAEASHSNYDATAMPPLEAETPSLEEEFSAEKAAVEETSFEEPAPEKTSVEEESVFKPSAPDVAAEKEVEQVFDETNFAPREMPAIEEFPSPAGQPLESDATVSADIHDAIRNIADRLRESQVEAWLEKLMYSSDSTKQSISELVSELRESRKNQERMIELLKKIESSLRPQNKSAKRA